MGRIQLPGGCNLYENFAEEMESMEPRSSSQSFIWPTLVALLQQLLDPANRRFKDRLSKHNAGILAL